MLIHRLQHSRFSRLTGLRVQVLLWTVLPLTILLIVVSVSGVSSHQTSMRTLAVEENERLISALSALFSAQARLYAQDQGVPVDQVPANALDVGELFHFHAESPTNGLLLLDSAGNILIQLGWIDTDHLSHQPGVVQVMRGESGVIFTDAGEHSDLVAYAPVPDTEWRVVIRDSWHSLTDPLLRFEQVMPFVLLAAVVTSLATLFFGLRFVVRPLQELGMRAQRIGQGQFEAAGSPVGGVREIEDMRAALDHMAQRLQAARRELRDYIGAVTRAQEEERARLARELHDETVQTLIALGHKAQMAQRNLTRSPELAAERVGELRQMIAQAVEEVRRFSRALHPHYLEELGLVTALETLAKESGAVFETRGTPRRLHPDIELTFYRIAQEALSNARKHAQAQQIRVELLFHPAESVVRVSDDGQGFAIPDQLNELTRTGHYGLVGMRERSQLVDGKLQVTSAVGKGTTVQFSASYTSDSSPIMSHLNR